jgi:hypothetical protein
MLSKPVNAYTERCLRGFWETGFVGTFLPVQTLVAKPKTSLARSIATA